MTASTKRKLQPAFALEDGLAPAAILHLQTTDVDRVEAELRDAIQSAPQRFLYAPIIVDVSAIADDVMDLPLHDLAERMRACKLVPVGAASLPSFAVWNAAAAGMANVQPASATAATLTVARAVRSGQVVYAPDADLVVLASVNPGAQLIADGHVHVYGRMRGRATAGAKGNREARIFCQSLEAEVVSIGGQHIVADDIGRQWRGKPVQIWLDGDRLSIGPLV